MRVQEIGLTPCPKMTEERGKPINGCLSSGDKTQFLTKEEQDSDGPKATLHCDDVSGNNGIRGGSLKFFKDGKFILELSHHKEGERTCWVPVPKKTFWPAVGTPKQECSISLSVSDDNSSVQSSPWQRDHCWKQTAPVRNAGRGMEFMMMHPKNLCRLKYSQRSVRRKRRHPYDTSIVERNNIGTIKSVLHRTVLGINVVVQNLWNRVVRADPGIVSPRKRILREMERVSLEDQNNSKRQRPRPSLDQTKPISSHSITSILAREDEPSFLRSLLGSSPSSETLPPPVHLHQPLNSIFPYPSPSYASPATFYAPLPGYRGSPNVWALHHYPLSSVQNSYPMSSYPPVNNTPWNISYQAIDLKREDCTSDVPLNLSKDAG